MTHDNPPERKKLYLYPMMLETYERTIAIHDMMMMLHRKIDWIYEAMGTSDIFDVKQHIDAQHTDSTDEQTH
jgi:hypothetical protein